MEPGVIIIVVENGRTIVALVVEGYSNTLMLRRAKNWKELEERAALEVKEQRPISSSFRSTEYPCSRELAGLADFSSPG